MSEDSLADRLGRVAVLLTNESVPFTGLRAAGHEGDIIVIEGDPTLAVRIAALATAIRVIGFRFVTVDLAGGGHS